VRVAIPPSIPLWGGFSCPKKLSDSQRKEQFKMNRTRPKQIVIRVSEEELMQIKEKVAQSGKNQQQYNQIAHALNGKGYYSYNLITENQKELGQLWQSLRQFLQK